MEGFLTYRTIQTSPLLSKRLNGVLISRCQYPSRNPSSPLDCRAADRFVSPTHRPARTICYISSPLLSLFTQADVHSTATQVRATGERTKHGVYRGDDAAVCPSLFAKPVDHIGLWISLFFGLGSAARITSHGTKPAFFRAIRRSVSPGVLTPVVRGKGEAFLEERD